MNAYLRIAAALVTCIMMLWLGALIAPQLGSVQVKPEDWVKNTGSPGYHARLPKSLAKHFSRGATLGLWTDVKAMHPAPRSLELAAVQTPAFRVKDGRNVFINEPLMAWLRETPSLTVRIALDTRATANDLAGLLGGVSLFFAMLGVLAGNAKPPMNPSAARYPQLDALRGLAALSVVVFHCGIGLYPSLWLNVNDQKALVAEAPAWALWIKQTPLQLLIRGDLMVSIFWVLSGVVLSLPFVKRLDYGRLFVAAAKRYLRLLPLVFVSVMLSYVLMQSGLYAFQNFTEASGYPANTLVKAFGGPPEFLPAIKEALYGALLNESAFNAPLWTISLELFGSWFLFLLLAVTLQLRWRRFAWLAAVIVLACLGPTAQALLNFVLGLLLADFMVGNGKTLVMNDSRRMAWLALSLCIMVGTAAPGWLSLRWPGVEPMLGTVLDHVAALGFVACAALFTTVANGLSTRPLVWLGERSFALYVIHAPVLASLGQWSFVGATKLGLGLEISRGLAAVMTIVSSLAVADFLFKRVDRPGMDVANAFGRWLSQKQSAQGETAGDQPVTRV